jgi:hypothetical protein
MDMETGRLESAMRLSRLVPSDSGIESTPDARLGGRTGRGHNTVRRLLQELTDLTVYA